MKNKYLSILILLLTSILYISCDKNESEEITEDIYVTIPDIKFEEELIALGIDSDNTVNHQILKTDAKSVERLSISFNNIENLEGIESFVNLKRLYADANNLKTINLSNNTLLDTISLSSNELTSVIGLSKVKNLKWLSLSFNYFQEFILENSSIETLLITNNDIILFDATKAPSLRFINLGTNNIEHLDFTQNLLLENLFFSANKLETINLDANVNLKYIYCSSNLLKEFDVSKLDKLIDLRVNRNTDLSCVKIAENQNIPTLILSSYQEVNVNCN